MLEKPTAQQLPQPASCAIEGCTAKVNREGHQFCYAHWKESRSGGVRQCAGCDKWFAMRGTYCPTCGPQETSAAPRHENKSGGTYSSTKLGDHFGISSRRVNLILAELGWIEKYVKGWVPTEQGRRQGGLKKEMRDNGVPYVVWPSAIISNKMLLGSIRETQAEDIPEATTEQSKPADRDPAATEEFRNRFPAKFRTTDGHRVRSRAELLIDNWLYMQKIVHAYERRVPVEEERLFRF